MLPSPANILMQAEKQQEQEQEQQHLLYQQVQQQFRHSASSLLPDPFFRMPGEPANNDTSEIDISAYVKKSSPATTRSRSNSNGNNNSNNNNNNEERYGDPFNKRTRVNPIYVNGRPLLNQVNVAELLGDDDDDDETYFRERKSKSLASNATKRRGNLPKAATKILKHWIYQHMSNPYPSEDEKEYLIEITGLTLKTLDYWFTNARRRILPKMVEHAKRTGGGPLDDPDFALQTSPVSKTSPTITRNSPSKKRRVSATCTLCLDEAGDEILLTCSKCAESQHPSCLQLKSVAFVDTETWLCNSCKACEKCHDGQNEAKTLICELCDRAYHIYCLDPPLTTVPNGTWLCQSCAKRDTGRRRARST